MYFPACYEYLKNILRHDHRRLIGFHDCVKFGDSVYSCTAPDPILAISFILWVVDLPLASRWRLRFVTLCWSQIFSLMFDFGKRALNYVLSTSVHNFAPSKSLVNHSDQFWGLYSQSRMVKRHRKDNLFMRDSSGCCSAYLIRC